MNRTAVVVMPRPRFLEWLHRVDPRGFEVTLEDLRADPSVYLLPDSEHEEAQRRGLRKFCAEIFEDQLEAWYRDSSLWPPSRNFRTFKEWFDFSMHSIVIDLSPGPLKGESL